MKLGLRLFCAYAAILVICFAYPVVETAHILKLAYLQSAEDPLVDMANVLAAFVGRQAERGQYDAEELYLTFDQVYGRDVAAQIYSLIKDRVDVRVYVADIAGTVLFDSLDRKTIGADYSRWRDVRRTLLGQYGARVERTKGDRDAPTALLVAAPVMVNGTTAGVLTVSKPTLNLEMLFQSAKPELVQIAGLSAGAAILLCFLVSLWVTEQTRRLTSYANDVREGRRVPFPKLAQTELLAVGNAFEKMRETLAGRAYVEQYVQTLTHEIKSPISAIQGAAEILAEPQLPEPRRAQFLANIQSETSRIKDLVDRMLRLTALEAQRALPNCAPVLLAPIVHTILESQATVIEAKALVLEVDVAEDLGVCGDEFLLHLALSNLVQNAVEFSPCHGRLIVRAHRSPDAIELHVQDEGPGIPSFAKERVFEKFFSLPRPDTGKKSTGLGLNFVREVMALHHGSVRLESLSQGLLARLRIPS